MTDKNKQTNNNKKKSAIVKSLITECIFNGGKKRKQKPLKENNY